MPSLPNSLDLIQKNEKERYGVGMKYLKTYRLYLLVFACVIMFASTRSYGREATIDTELSDDIVVILDVSGSMKKTDTDRLCFESIELLLNLCEDDDRIGVVAFDEDIVYQSRLVKGSDKEAIREIRQQLSQVEYQGDTDNGLGLKAGVSMLTAQDHTYRNQTVIFISDGKTDLPDGRNGRTVEDSYADMESAKNIAVAQGISIHTIGLCTSDSDIADELTAMSAATKGTSNICSGPLQMMNKVADIAMQYKPEGQNGQNTVKPGNSLQTQEISIPADNTVYIIFEASKPILDFKVISRQEQIQVYETRHSRIVRCSNTSREQLSICYRCEEGGNAIIQSSFIQEEQEQPQEVEVPKSSTPEEKPVIQETQQPQEQMVEKSSNPYLIPAIAILVMVTAGISAGIIYAFNRKPRQEKKLPVLKGYLHACFIDLKSKNDIPDMEWNLKDYPEAGVSLRELFQSSGIEEDLPQLDQICLYPDEEGEGLLLVHCTEGGVFVNDRTVSSNVPARVRYGETIYIAFPKNASEFSLRYFEKKEAR